MRRKTCMIIMLMMYKMMVVAQPDTLVLCLQDAIRKAQEQSPSAQSARNTFLAAHWNYRYFRANYRPSVTLSSTPYINKEMNRITQGDGTAKFIQQDQFGADLQ